MSKERCAALNKNGARCTSDAVPETDWWRCLKHVDWYATATREEIESLALMEIEETIRSLGPARPEDLDTRRTGRYEAH